jgi:hypothetical protein
MSPQNLSEKSWPDPLPQVGAVLYLDTEVSPPDYTGGKRWKLTGSCVLVSPDQILTIGHTLAARSEILPEGHYAAFFPYEGLVPITGLLWEDKQISGDNLALADLGRRVVRWPQLRPFYNDTKGFKHSVSAQVCGYGVWRGSPLGGLEGLQQQHLVPLGAGSGKLRIDHLDISWSSHGMSGLVMGRGNSGGPLLWSERPLVVGINREVAGDQQVASWITNDRMSKWLDAGALHPAAHATPALKTAWKLLEITPEKGAAARFEVPAGAKRVHATLNASPGLRLRMDLPGDHNTNTGRFLSREAPLPEGAEEVVITVGRAPRSPYKAGQKVLAQLCLLFK